MNEEHEKLFQRLVSYMEDVNKKQISVLKEGVAELKEEIKTEIAEIKTILTEESKKRREIETKQIEIEKRVSHIEKTLRKNNIVIFGLQPNEENVLSYTIEQLNQLLTLNINTLHINNLIPLGKAENNPPILVQFTSFLTKLEVLKQCKKLKGTGVYICEDLSKEERENRKILEKHQKQARSKNLNAYIRNNKLVVNNDVYTIEELQNLESDWEEENIQEDLNEIDSTLKEVNNLLITPEPTVSTNNKEKADEHEDEIENTKITKKRTPKTSTCVFKPAAKPTTRNTTKKGESATPNPRKKQYLQKQTHQT